MSVRKTFLGKKLLFLTAHPDDESYTAAGTIFKNRRAGGASFLVCASHGEGGASHLKKPLTKTRLKTLRKKELCAVAKFLRVAKLFLLELPDGSIKRHKNALLKKFLAVARRVNPHVVLSFGKDGITGHHDHIAVGKVAREVAHHLHKPFVAFALSPRAAQNAKKWLRRRRRAPHYRNIVGFKKPTIRIPIDAKVKLRALRFHASQLDQKDPFAGFPSWAKKELLSAEYFVA